MNEYLSVDILTLQECSFDVDGVAQPAMTGNDSHRN